jgi:ABC-type glycerol-3-phosphate transport system substrate-binding protein
VKKINKIAAAILSLIMLILTGCGEEPEPPTSEGPTPKFFYERELINTPDGSLENLQITDGFVRANDSFILIATKGDMLYQTLTRLYIYDDNTVKIEDFPAAEYTPPITERHYVGFYKTASGYTVVYMGITQLTSLTFDYYDENFALLNTVKSSLQFDGFRDLLYDGTDFYLLYEDERGSGISVFDEKGQIKDDISPPRGAMFAAIALSPEGQLIYSYNEPGSFKQKIEGYGNNGTPPFEITTRKPVGYLMRGGFGYAAFGMDSQYIYGYKSNGIVDTIMPISDLDMVTMSFIMFAQGGDERTCFSTDFKTGELVRNTYTLKIPEPDNRTVLTLSTDYEIQAVTYAVSAFNRLNTEYRIEIIELDDRDNPEISGFDKALISGTLGDILSPPTEGNEHYIEKGIYSDLYPLIKNDPDFSKDMILPQVLSALETDGKLLRIWNTFSVSTYFMPEGGLPPTYANIRKLIEENPVKHILPFYSESSEETLTELLKYNASYFGDTEKLNGNEIRDLLWICKNFDIIERDAAGEYDLVEWNGFYQRFETGRGYYKNNSIFSINDLIGLREAQTSGAAKSVPAGNPAPAGLTKNYIIGRDVAINNASENKEAAWEFLKFYMAYDPYVDSFGGGPHSFPILKTRFDELAKNELADADEIRAEKGEEYTDKFIVFDFEYSINLLTETDYDEFYAIIDNAVTPERYDLGLFNIIAEEAAPYFDDKKTLDEVLELINNRAATYIAERE